ncbi:MAG TPA: Crp/Fnr family transcriptional regulator [Pyrinomonadaceae bacterium]|nr:Crp/Fnr family transcriptional regulator [Pyrinomonadaceae bacterium]
MQNATNLDEKEGKTPRPSPCEALRQLFLECDDIKLTYIHPRGAVLFAEGQSAAGVYLLRTGRAKASISSASGKTVILRVEQAGALLGVNSVVKGVPHDVTVETIERCRIDFIPRYDFMKLLDKTDPALIGVAHTLGNELSDALEHVRSLLLSRSAAEKLARLLLKWCDEQGEPGPEGVRVNPGLTHEEISQMICTSRETVTRLFAALRRNQIVGFDDNALHVRNRKALESLAWC